MGLPRLLRRGLSGSGSCVVGLLGTPVTVGFLVNGLSEGEVEEDEEDDDDEEEEEAKEPEDDEVAPDEAKPGGGEETRETEG